MSVATNPKLKLANAFKNKGETSYGTFMMLSSSCTAKVVAQVGWDFVLIDCEHGNIGDSDMYDSVLGVAASNVSPIVRVRNPDIGLLKRALDTGAHGIMVPMVNTAEEARNIVKWCKFPPMGVRGQGSPFSAFASGLTTPEYVKTANQNILTIVQIETPEAVKNAAEIAAVEGVDCVFVGPNDLSLAMQGYAPPKWDEPDFLAAIDSVVEVTRKAGKAAGILMPDGAKGKWAKERWGIEMLAVGGDVKALQFWLGAQLAATKA